MKLDEEEWRDKYALRLKNHGGLPWAVASECAEAAEYDPDEDPEWCADCELDYWASS